MEITKDPTQINLRWFRDLTKINLKWFSPQCRIFFKMVAGLLRIWSRTKTESFVCSQCNLFGLYKVLLTLFASRGPIAVLLLVDKRLIIIKFLLFLVIFFSFNLKFLMLSVFCNKVTSIRDVNDNVRNANYMFLYIMLQ